MVLAKAPKQAQEDISPTKIDMTSKSPVGNISIVTLIRTNTTLDHYILALSIIFYINYIDILIYIYALFNKYIHFIYTNIINRSNIYIWV